jgi:predicted kinase
LWGDEATQGDNNEVFYRMQHRAIDGLNFGYNVIYDATNITRKDRAGIIAACPKFAKIEAHVVFAPIETCIERDAARERTVGKEVINKMLKRFQAPFVDEGIDEIKIKRSYTSNPVDYDNYIYNAMEIPHDNPHHTLNIMDHCKAAYHYVYDRTKENDIRNAALIHDIGKPYVKAFIDSKGNPCEIAHYYQHQCVGAWMSYGLDDITPFAAWLISTHMDPYLNTKYYNKLPAYLKKQVDLLHEADRNAH